MSLLQRFVAHAQDKSVVTFDIFDTLIERNCLVPSDLFYRVGLALFKGNSAMAHEFQRCREAAEVELRAAAPNAEVSLADPRMTDDNALLEGIGVYSYLTETGKNNIKLTTAEDLLFAGYLLTGENNE